KQHKLAARYLREYSSIARHTPRSLWLGIQIERVNGDADAMASYVLALRNLYPKSPEYRRYMETKNND
ncbi:MAG TPA: type IV pilus biogenesis/stability protein PilW, partial [Gammaproteobacteria bacterium]|nr:type IV pilus biogenesis/stability protein PilW [Gammaproteobacteria bacterium]